LCSSSEEEEEEEEDDEEVIVISGTHPHAASGLKEYCASRHGGGGATSSGYDHHPSTSCYQQHSDQAVGGAHSIRGKKHDGRDGRMVAHRHGSSKQRGEQKMMSHGKAEKESRGHGGGGAAMRLQKLTSIMKKGVDCRASKVFQEKDFELRKYFKSHRTFCLLYLLSHMLPEIMFLVPLLLLKERITLFAVVMPAFHAFINP
jgi:hypothetical protein